MNESAGHVELIEKARLGDQKSMDSLAQLVEPRLYVYLYRLTLNDDLARDLLQETLLKMIESLKDLKRPERFWHWLFRTALGKVQHHYRDRSKEYTIQMSVLSREYLADYVDEDCDDGLSRAMKEELSETVCMAMTELRLNYRNVLVLRCFEQLSFDDIAEMMGCKELGARVVFCRAKKSLQKLLSRKGFGKEMLITALGLFGLLTAPAKTASATGAITASSLNVGVLAALVAAVASRVGVAVAAGITAVVVGVNLQSFLLTLLFLLFVFVCFIIALYVQWQ